MAESIDPVTESSTEPEKGGATKATRGRPPAEFYMQEYGQSYRPQVDDNYYQQRCNILERELHEVQSKNRLLSEELFKARKELSDDRTELLLKHHNEVTKLKEDFRDKIESERESNRQQCREKDKEIDQLDKELYKKTLQSKNSDQSDFEYKVEVVKEIMPYVSGPLGSFISALFRPPQGNQIPQTHQQPAHQHSVGPENTSQGIGSAPNENETMAVSDEDLKSFVNQELNKDSEEVTNEI